MRTVYERNGEGGQAKKGPFSSTAMRSRHSCHMRVIFIAVGLVRAERCAEGAWRNDTPAA